MRSAARFAARVATEIARLLHSGSRPTRALASPAAPAPSLVPLPWWIAAYAAQPLGFVAAADANDVEAEQAALPAHGQPVRFVTAASAGADVAEAFDLPTHRLGALRANRRRGRRCSCVCDRAPVAPSGTLAPPLWRHRTRAD